MSGGAVTLDETARPHKSIDWRKFAGPNDADCPENLGIYACEGDDAIKFCRGGPGNERPTAFKAGEDGSPNSARLVMMATRRIPYFTRDDGDKENSLLHPIGQTAERSQVRSGCPAD